MLALTADAETKASLRRRLQQLFRSESTILLGFGLEGDLRAIAGALGNEGGGCVSRVRGYVDVQQLHSHLRHSGAPVAAAAGTGLAGAFRSCSPDADAT